MYSIIYNHEDFLIVNKQQGVCIHDEPGQSGLINVLKNHLNTSVFPVHRLDKGTSGLLIVAKTSAAASELSLLFQQRQIQKFYLAQSDKTPKKKQGLICGDMVRSRRSSWKLLKTRENPAITQFFSFSLYAGRRLFIVKPTTGKTHQIRVALKSIGAPIVNDGLYAGSKIAKEQGIYLHALALIFHYQGKPYQFLQLPPSEWFGTEIKEELMNKINQPWLLEWSQAKINSQKP